MNERTDQTAETDGVRTTTVEASAPKATMAEFNHGNPYTGETFGDEMAFERGPAVAADGGERNAVPRASSDPRSDGGKADAEGRDDETMADVDHEHPHDDAADANTVFERGKTVVDDNE
jgi:hypothetical protein